MFSIRTIRFVALAEATSFLVLLTSSVIKRTSAPEGAETAVLIFGSIHGALFVAYVLIALVVRDPQGWTAKQTLLVLIGAVVPFSCAFDGRDYVVGWRDNEGNGVFSTHIARISPLGAPDVRVQKLNFPNPEQIFPPPAPSFALVASAGKLFAWHWDGPSSQPPLHILPISQTGALGPETRVSAQTLITDGASLYAVGDDNGNAFVSQLDLTKSPPEVKKTYLGTQAYVYAFSAPPGFIIGWAGQPWTYAYFRGGVELFRTNALVTGVPEMAANAETLLIASPTRHYSPNVLFQTVNLATREVNSAESYFGKLTALDLAASDRDFLAVAATLRQGVYYVGASFITTAEAPAFEPSHVKYLGIETDLVLQPERRYRIETSTDLIHWELTQVVSGVSNWRIETQGAEKTFVRAILVPE